MEDDAQGMAGAVMNGAYAMLHIYPVVTSCAFYGPEIRCKN